MIREFTANFKLKLSEDSIVYSIQVLENEEVVVFCNCGHNTRLEQYDLKMNKLIRYYDQIVTYVLVASSKAVCLQESGFLCSIDFKNRKLIQAYDLKDKQFYKRCELLYQNLTTVVARWNNVLILEFFDDQMKSVWKAQKATNKNYSLKFCQEKPTLLFFNEKIQENLMFSMFNYKTKEQEKYKIALSTNLPNKISGFEQLERDIFFIWLNDSKMSSTIILNERKYRNKEPLAIVQFKYLFESPITYLLRDRRYIYIFLENQQQPNFLLLQKRTLQIIFRSTKRHTQMIQNYAISRRRPHCLSFYLLQDEELTINTYQFDQI